MKIKREELNKEFELILVRYASDQDDIQKITMKCYKDFNLPFFRSQTIITMGASSVELKDVEIYWILSAIKDTNKTANFNLDKYFTDIEIDNYSKLKYADGSVTFPITIPCLKLNDNQWICVINANTLIKWRGSILRYNKDIQRRLMVVVRKGMTYETISLNMKSVNEMINLFLQGKFISNTLTVNIPDDEIDFYYDNENHELVINSINHLDLTDGYHRLVSLSKAKEINPDFDYMMGLMITNFSDSMASQYINQEEQRNVMPKRAVETYNMENVSNRILRRVNGSIDCNLQGKIVNGGRCDLAYLSAMLDYCLVRKMTDSEKEQAILKAPREVIAVLNTITEAEPETLTSKLTVLQVRAMAYCCARFYGKEKEKVYDVYNILANSEYSQKERIDINGAERRALAVFEAKLKGGRHNV